MGCVLIYDGDCGFCTSSASWLMRVMSAPGGFASDDSVVVAPWQSLDLDEFGLTEENVTTAAYWVDPDGSLHRGHYGIAKALRFGGKPWSLAGAVIASPAMAWLAGPTYALIAKNRHRLPGSTDACKLNL